MDDRKCDLPVSMKAFSKLLETLDLSTPVNVPGKSHGFPERDGSGQTVEEWLAADGREDEKSKD